MTNVDHFLAALDQFKTICKKYYIYEGHIKKAYCNSCNNSEFEKNLISVVISDRFNLSNLEFITHHLSAINKFWKIYSKL